MGLAEAFDALFEAAEPAQRIRQIVLRAGPAGCRALARALLQRQAERLDRPGELLGVMVECAQPVVDVADIVHGRGPVERHAFAVALGQREIVGLERLFERLGLACHLADAAQRQPEIVLQRGPFQRIALTRDLLHRLAQRRRAFLEIGRVAAGPQSELVVGGREVDQRFGP